MSGEGRGREAMRPRRPAGWASNAALLVVPAALLYLVVLVVPMLLLAVRSLSSGSGFSAAAYARFAADPFYWRVLGDTLSLAAIVTAACVVVGWPVAFVMTQVAGRTARLVLTAIVVAPLLISVVVRTFGWVVLLGADGPLDLLLGALGARGGGLLYTRTAVAIGMVHIMLPMTVVSIAASFGSIDPAVFRAALNLGASPLGAVWRVLVPLTAPGILAGAVIVFGVTASAFVTPAVLGGSTLRFMSTLIYQDAVVTLDFGRGGALAIVLLATTLLSLAALSALVERVLAPGAFARRSG